MRHAAAIAIITSCAFPAEERPNPCEIERGTYELFATITPSFPAGGCPATLTGSLEVGESTLALSIDGDPTSPLQCVVSVSNDTADGCLSQVHCAPSCTTQACTPTASLSALAASGALTAYLSPPCGAQFRLAGTLR